MKATINITRDSGDIQVEVQVEGTEPTVTWMDPADPYAGNLISRTIMSKLRENDHEKVIPKDKE